MLRSVSPIKPPAARRPLATFASGFTLVEILVALAIVSVALVAAYRSVGQSTETADAVRARTMALWVAQNRLAEIQLAPALAEPGEREGAASQGGTRFWWRERITSTPNPQFRRIDITVGEPQRPTYALAELVGYISRQPPR